MITNPRKYKKFDRQGAEKYAGVVQNIFSPIYPVLARLFVDRFHINSGICIDIGSGTAALAIELARISDMTVYAVDHADEIQDIAAKMINDVGMAGRVHITRADVLAMPFEDNFADLIVSRGSFIFWKKLPSAFNEIYRVMKPGGNACIGGGFGSLQMKDTINKKMLERNPHRTENRHQGSSDIPKVFPHVPPLS